jgi:hypothetical protein
VIRRHVLAALAVGVERGGDDAAREALSRADWILRGRARRRLEGVLIEAALATGVHNFDDPDATRYVLQAAALIVQGRSEAELVDRDRVAAAYRAARVVAPMRLPIATIVAAVIAFATATTVCAATLYVVTDNGPPGVYQRPAPPNPIGAFRDGGVPSRDPAIEQVLAVELPRFVVMSYAITGHEVLDDADLQRRVAGLRDQPAFVTHGQRPRMRGARCRQPRSLDGAVVGDLPYRVASGRGPCRIDVVSGSAAAVGSATTDPEIVDEARAGAEYYKCRRGWVRARDRSIRVSSYGSSTIILDTSAALLRMKAEELGDPWCC